MLFIENFTIGGTEQQIVELARRLNSERYDVIVACKFSEGSLLSEIKRAGLQTFEVPLRSFHELNAIKQFYQLVKFLRDRKIQILHTTGNMGNTFVALAGLVARVPVIITSRRDLGGFIPDNLRTIQKAVAKWTSTVIVNAECIKQKLINEEKISADKIQIIRNGIDLSRFDVNSAETEAVRREFNLDTHAPVIGVVANLKPVKGQNYFLEAFKQVLDRYPEARALIVGECEDDWDKKLHKQCRELGIEKQVIFTGYRANIPELLSAISLFVLPSLSEGLPNALMEAMASGLPAVATAVGGTLELIVNEENGLLVQPANSDELAAAMLRVIADEKLGARLAATAQKRIGKLAMNRMVQNTEALYERLVASRGLKVESFSSNPQPLPRSY